jgi:hypothetical protein
MLFVVVACSSPGASTGGGDDGGNGSEQSQAAESTPTPDATSDDGGGSGDDGGSGGGTGDADVDEVYAKLTPPNATEITKTTTGGVIFAAWDSSDSLESLQSFYEDAFDDADLTVVSTTQAQGGYAWVVARGEDSNFGGAVSIFPASDGSGTQVSITIGAEQ